MQLTVRMPDEYRKKIEILAEEMGLKKSDIARLACRHLNPIRYVVRGASHPVISAMVARPRRVRRSVLL